MENRLVTGGSGFVGRNLIRQLLSRYPDVRITSVSRSEGSISRLITTCNNCDRLKIVPGDVRDMTTLKYAMKNKDTVIHLAAMKRVELGEVVCREVVTTNVLGTVNILDNFNGETFILMSTDKAVEPVNCYGATKMVCEKLVLDRAREVESGVRYMVIRSGNIMGSTGSVLDTWREQIEERNEITVTHPDMVRFYTSIDGVVRLYSAVLEHGENGKIYFTPHGDAMFLRDLVKEALRRFGNESTKVRYIGLRPGERMEEKMSAREEPNCVSGFEERFSCDVVQAAQPQALTPQ